MNQKKINLETLLFAAAFVLALLVRFIHLGQLPLNDYEALPALQALSTSSGQAVIIGEQPAYVMLTASIFQVLDATNFAARFWPALAGALIVLVPFLLRSRMPGRTGLIAALFLAVDPALVAMSRSAGGQSMAVVFGLLALALLIDRKKVAGAIFLGLAAASDVSFWLGLIIFLAASLIGRLKSSQRVEGYSWKDWGLVAGIAVLSAVLSSTGFLFHPEGLSGIGNGLMGFISRWGAVPTLSLKDSLLVLLATYVPLLILASMGYIAVRKNHPEHAFRFLTGFIAALLLVGLFSGRDTSDWAWVVLPLWGLASMGIDAAVRHAAEGERLITGVEVVLAFSLIIFSLLNLMAYFFNSYGDAVQDRNRLIGAGLPILLLIIVTVFLAWGWSPRSALRGLGLGIGMLLCVWIFSAGMKSAGALTQVSAVMWKPQAIFVDEDLLVSQVENLSLWNHGQRHKIDIEVVNYDTPGLHWALRRFSDVTWDLHYSSAETPSVIIAPDYQQIGSTTLYRGQSIAWAQYPSFSKMGIQQWLRWIFYRQAPVDEIRLILYARNDLFKQ